MTLREFVETASARTEKVFNITGKVPSMYHFVVEGKDVILPAPPYPKDIALVLMRETFKLLDVTRYVFIDEAWTVLLQKTENVTSVDAAMARAKEQLPPSEHPDRQEVVMFFAEDEAEGFFLARRFIERDADGKGTLGPLDTEQPLISAGRITGLLPVKGTKQ